jgi:hypothetical protein
MSNNPINLAIRFILEIAGLVAYGYWGFTVYDGIAEWLFGIGVPLVAAAVWGVFRVPNDGGKPVVQVSGIVRLLIEALFFGGAVVMMNAAGQPDTALILGTIVILHYISSWDRILRLLRS